MATMAEALAPLRARLPRAVQEREILRVAALVKGSDTYSAAHDSRREVLAWAQKRSGGRLPNEAWALENFEYFAGGRVSIGVRLETDDADVWAIRTDDPDKTVAGRTWTTEVTIGYLRDGATRLSVRLLVNSPEDAIRIEPHSPGFVQQIANKQGLIVDDQLLKPTPVIIDTDQSAHLLADLIEKPNRLLPVFIASGDERSANPNSPLIDADLLAHATLGLAHVAFVSPNQTYILTDRFGKQRSVFFGAARAYMPHFNVDSDPYDHPLFIADIIVEKEDGDRCLRRLRSIAASQSLQRTRIGHDILPFSTVRTSTLRVQHEKNKESSEQQQLESALKQIDALRAEIQTYTDLAEQFYSLQREAEARAEAAESQAVASTHRIQQLLDRFSAQGEAPDADNVLPTDWGIFAEWCDYQLAGRLVLAPAARRSVKSPRFEDASQAARCLLWLANDCRSRRLFGGTGSLRDAIVEPGIKNCLCGGDEFDFDWRGNPLTADWHIKNGGNTREPARCLRIYYTWDPNTQQIIVADMPAHRRTGAT